MALIITELKQPAGEPEELLKQRLADLLGVSQKDILRLRLMRRTLDARHKNDIHFLMNVLVEMEGKAELRLAAKGDPRIRRYDPQPQEELSAGTEPCPGAIVVVGMGPAGLFAALTLAQYGYRPILVERGRPVGQRVADVETFFQTGRLNPESNVMFGEGGAGTFSDGKLTSRSKDPRGALVLEVLSHFGAPEAILWDAKPHIGTDRLRRVVAAMGDEIRRLGGQVRYETRLAGIHTTDGRVTAVTLATIAGEETLSCGALVLAIGQGARDTYRMLLSSGVAMGKKPFAVGVRVEHPQAMINKAQFGPLADCPRLGAAEYRLTGKSGGRGVYTFCMCPGGQVIASSSGEGEVVVNGMSNLARDGENANAAIVVQVMDEDTPDEPLAGLHFAEEMERAAFLAGGGDYRAPGARIEDFLKNRATRAFSAVRPTYLPGVRPVHLGMTLPPFVAKGVFDGIRSFAGQLAGFDLGDGVLTGVETRTSAPVRILRNEEMESVSVKGIYPVGEGAGYAGGIVSAAIDGRKAAERIIGRFASK
jgi:uncharacterized FAD-dependent dehydrogenase